MLYESGPAHPGQFGRLTASPKCTISRIVTESKSHMRKVIWGQSDAK